MTKASAFSKIGVLGGISASLKAVHDEKVLTSPSDFVEAVRIVHTKTNEGQTDLFHALSKTEDFCQLYGTSEGIRCFIHFIKTQNSLNEYRYSYQKKSILSHQ